MEALLGADDSMDSRLNPNYTFHYDKFSCVAGFYYFHITLNYLIFFCGLLCFLSRAVPGTKWIHIWVGRLYILFMLWSTVSALLIHNTGLPTGVLVSFLWVLLGLTIGWFTINAHQIIMQRSAFKAVEEKLQQRSSNAGPIDLDAMISAEKGKIAASKTFKQRLFSLKALHGALMFMSWTNIAGRIFATKLTDDFTCYTYPYYKQIDTKDHAGAGKPITPVEVHDPTYLSKPWGKTGLAGWAVALSLGPLALAFGVGAGWSGAVEYRKRQGREVAAGTGAAPRRPLVELN